MNIIRKDKNEANVCHVNPMVTVSCPTKHCFGNFVHSTDAKNVMSLSCSTDENNEVTFKILSTLELTTMKSTDEISFVCNYDKCNQPGNVISLLTTLQNSIHNISMIRIILNETTELMEETSTSLTTEEPLSSTISKTTDRTTTRSSTISSTTSNKTNQTTIVSSTIPNKSAQHFHNIYIYIVCTILSLIISIYKPFI